MRAVRYTQVPNTDQVCNKRLAVCNEGTSDKEEVWEWLCMSFWSVIIGIHIYLRLYLTHHTLPSHKRDEWFIIFKR